MIPSTTKMCDEARAIPDFKARRKHYAVCHDPRCQARHRIGNNLAKQIANEMRKTRRSHA